MKLLTERAVQLEKLAASEPDSACCFNKPAHSQACRKAGGGSRRQVHRKSLWLTARKILLSFRSSRRLKFRRPQCLPVPTDQEGEVMTRSVEELRRESERSRAELAATVGRLKEQISDTADDIRHKVSPQHIKSEVTEYVSHKTQSWVEGLKQQIMENPMRAVAAGAAVGIPLLRMARGVPFPLLMIGAGLALTSKTVRDRAADATGPVIDKAGGMLEEVREGALAMQGDAKETLSSAQSRAAGIAGDAQDKAADLRGSAARTASVASEKLKSGMDATKDAAASVPDQARQTIGDNAALIGGLGIAIGAIIAAALPETKAEARVMGRASDEMKQAAAAAAQSGFEAAKGATTSATDAAAQKVAEADLASHASRMTQNMADTLKEAADDVVKAAFSPSQTNT